MHEQCTCTCIYKCVDFLKLLCFVVCMTLLASFLLPSASLINMYLPSMYLVVDPCEDMDCHHSCIVHEAIPHCFCDYGNMLADDKKTCIGELYMYMNNHMHRAPFSDIEISSKERRKENSHIHKLLNYTTTSTGLEK